jgi:hypothetical protein
MTGNPDLTSCGAALIIDLWLEATDHEAEANSRRKRNSTKCPPKDCHKSIMFDQSAERYTRRSEGEVMNSRMEMRSQVHRFVRPYRERPSAFPER